MKFKTKILLDRTAGHILCFFAGAAAWVLGRILRRDHSIKESNVRVIAIAKYFGMGSITHSVPMLRALKNKYPAVKLIFITRKNNKDIIPLISYIDKAFYIDDNSLVSLFTSNAVLMLNLWREKIDLFFDLEVFSTYGVLVSLFSLARNRLGFFFHHYTHLKTWIYTHLMYFNFQMPLRLSYMQLARLAGAPQDASLDLENFHLDESVYSLSKKHIEEIIGNSGRSGTIGINVNASELSFIRRWSIEKFSKIASHFAAKGYAVLLFGSQGEKEYAEQIFNCLETDAKIVCYTRGGGIYNIAGMLSLPEVLAALKLCDVFVTNDSGLMNLAYAQDAKVVALYGANAPSFVHIDNGVNAAVYKKTFCSPCLYIFDDSPCGTGAFCLENILVGEVICAVEKILEGSEPSGAVCKDNCITASKDSGYVMGTLRVKI